MQKDAIQSSNVEQMQCRLWLDVWSSWAYSRAFPPRKFT